MLQYFEKAPQVMMTSKGKHGFLEYLYANYDKTSYHESYPFKKKKEERALIPRVYATNIHGF